MCQIILTNSKWYFTFLKLQTRKWSLFVKQSCPEKQFSIINSTNKISNWNYVWALPLSRQQIVSWRAALYIYPFNGARRAAHYLSGQLINETLIANNKTDCRHAGCVYIANEMAKHTTGCVTHPRVSLGWNRARLAPQEKLREQVAWI